MLIQAQASRVLAKKCEAYEREIQKLEAIIRRQELEMRRLRLKTISTDKQLEEQPDTIACTVKLAQAA